MFLEFLPYEDFFLPVIFQMTTENVNHIWNVLTIMDAIQILVNAVLVHNSAIYLPIFEVISDDVFELHIKILIWTFPFPIPRLNLSRQKCYSHGVTVLKHGG